MSDSGKPTAAVAAPIVSAAAAAAVSKKKPITKATNEGGIKKKKVTREYAKRARMSEFYYGENRGKKGSKKKKEISYANYAKVLETDGELFASSLGDEESSILTKKDHRNIKKSGDAKQKPQTRVVRFKKDAKLAHQRLLIIFLKRICTSCKSICSLENLSKIKEKNVYTQMRFMYPPSEQEKIIGFCKKKLQSYIDSKV